MRVHQTTSTHALYRAIPKWVFALLDTLAMLVVSVAIFAFTGWLVLLLVIHNVLPSNLTTAICLFWIFASVSILPTVMNARWGKTLPTRKSMLEELSLWYRTIWSREALMTCLKICFGIPLVLPTLLLVLPPALALYLTTRVCRVVAARVAKYVGR